MNLVLQREPSGANATLGKLTRDDGLFLCDTLEDRIREPADWKPTDPVTWKVPGETAIPSGTYRIALTLSHRFGRTLPLLMDVPGFDGIRIHPGNTAKDTEGCILTGVRMGPSTVVESRAAFLIVYQRIQEALNEGEKVYISVRNP